MIEIYFFMIVHNKNDSAHCGLIFLNIKRGEAVHYSFRIHNLSFLCDSLVGPCSQWDAFRFRCWCGANSADNDKKIGPEWPAPVLIHLLIPTCHLLSK